MIGVLQRNLYRLGIMSPILIVAAVIRTIQMRRLSWPIILVFIISLSLLLYHIAFFFLCKTKLPAIDFFPDGPPQENDRGVIEITFSYLIPFTELLLNDHIPTISSWLLPGLECLILLILLTLANNTVPSPVFFLLGYHYHTVGVAGKSYTMISKRKNYRNAKSIRKVKRIFDDLLVVYK